MRNICQFTEDGQLKCILDELLEHILVVFIGKKSYSITPLSATAKRDVVMLFPHRVKMVNKYHPLEQGMWKDVFCELCCWFYQAASIIFL